MKKVDSILGFILLVFVGIFYFMTSQLPKDAMIYPMFVTSILLLLTLVHLAITYFKKDSEEAEEFRGLEVKQLLTVLGLSGIYVGLIQVIGYLVTTVLYVVSTLLMLKVDKKVSVSVSVGFSILVYILFKTLLKVPLPTGILM